MPYICRLRSCRARHSLSARKHSRLVTRSIPMAGEGLSKRVKLDDMVKTVTAPQLRAMLEDPSATLAVALVDVRLPEEVAVSVIPASPPHAFLTQAEFEERKGELKDHMVVAYCTVGYRSAQFVRRLQREGFEARNLAGSILSWTQEGYPLVVLPPAGSSVDGGPQPAPQPTNRVHVFGKQWELQGEGYEPVMFGSPFLQMAKWLGATALEKLGLGRLVRD